jgi:hypothetical protein
VSFTDQTAALDMEADMDFINMQQATVNLNRQIASLDRLETQALNIKISTAQMPAKNVDSNLTAPAQNKWKAKINQVNLANNSFSYDDTTVPTTTGNFNASHIAYAGISLDASSIYYKADSISADVRKFTAGSTGFTIHEFRTKFLMTPVSLHARQLVLKTGNSTVQANLDLSFPSLAVLKDSIGLLQMQATIKPATLGAADVLYFNPDLRTKPFFNNPSNVLTFSGNLKGQVSHLSGDAIEIRTATQTMLTTAFTITGLPNLEKTYFLFPSINLQSGNSDLYRLLGNAYMPTSVTLPDTFRLQTEFKGSVQAFNTSVFLTSNFGEGSVVATMEKGQLYDARISLHDFQLGTLLKKKELMHTASATVHTYGKGFKLPEAENKTNIHIEDVLFKGYTYHNIDVQADFRQQHLLGHVISNDSNCMLKLNAEAMLKDTFAINADIDLAYADFKKLNFLEKELRVGTSVNVHVHGTSLDSLTGFVSVNQTTLTGENKKYQIGSLFYASINTDTVASQLPQSIVGIIFNGTLPVHQLPGEISSYFNSYWQFDSLAVKIDSLHAANFDFTVFLNYHPAISALLMPGLTEFIPGKIEGDYDRTQKRININATVKRLMYQGSYVNDLRFKLNGDSSRLGYYLSVQEMGSGSVSIPSLIAQGTVDRGIAEVEISSIDSNGFKNIDFSTQLQNDKDALKIAFNNSGFVLANETWSLPVDNYLISGKQGMLFHDLQFKNNQQVFSIQSVNSKFYDDIKLEFKQFNLASLSKIISKDTLIVEGIVNGNVILQASNGGHGFISDATVTDLKFREHALGNLTLKASGENNVRYVMDIVLADSLNDVQLKGYILPDRNETALQLKMKINRLSMKSVEAFSMGQLQQSDGFMNAEIDIGGSTKNPIVAGSIGLDDIYTRPQVLNNRLHFVKEKIGIENNKINFRKFQLADEENNKAEVNGSVDFKNKEAIKLDLTLDADNFLVFNTAPSPETPFYGKLIVNSQLKIQGTPQYPVIKSKLKILKGSNVAFRLTDGKLTANRGEGVVVFRDTSEVNSLFAINDSAMLKNAALHGYDISSTIEVDKDAILKLFIDPESSDSLVVQGDAALSFAIDPSGKMSLTGSYNLTDGSYLVTFENVVKRKFTIEKGSTIIWNSDPLDADINIRAIYKISTSPIDLVADQLGGMSDAERNTYKSRIPFLVYLNLKGSILKPEISFEIQLPPEEKGAMGGAVNARLIALNENESALNKQVFALLVLGRFIQENPLESDGGGGRLSSVARNSVSRMLTQQLNRYGANLIPGVELNFDVQSYDDYSSGNAEGKTELGIGVKKKLFNERLSVQVGGTVGVEGASGTQTNTSDFTGDVDIDYKLTDDGRYLLKGFRHNQYQGALDGQLVETGVGIVFTRDFNKWKNIFKRRQERKGELLKPNDL